MLRTNLSFLSFVEQAYQSGRSDGGITLKSFPKGGLVLRQGSPATKVFIVKEGITKCYFSEENGKDYILEFLGAGETVGEIEVIKKMDCLCNIEAVTDVAVYAITIATFQSLLKNPDFIQLLLGELADRIINTTTRSSFQQLYTIEHGLKKLLSLQSRQEITLTKEDMAKYLGITLRSLNRLTGNKKAL